MFVCLCLLVCRVRSLWSLACTSVAYRQLEVILYSWESCRCLCKKPEVMIPYGVLPVTLSAKEAWACIVCAEIPHVAYMTLFFRVFPAEHRPMNLISFCRHAVLWNPLFLSPYTVPPPDKRP